MSRICVIGRGSWGARLQDMLSSEGLLADWPLLSRRATHEELDEYKERVRGVLEKSRGDVVWLAIPPADQALMVEAVIDVGRHVVAEKPWLVSPAITQKLVDHAQACGLVTAVPYIYCYLDKIVQKAEHHTQVKGFEGHFSIATKNRLGLDSLDNLGAHLLAIRRYVCPDADLLDLRTGYNSLNARSVTLHYNKAIEHIDFSNNKEPIVQRFAASFLSRVSSGVPFVFDLDFSSAVMEEVEGQKQRAMKAQPGMEELNILDKGGF